MSQATAVTNIVREPGARISYEGEALNTISNNHLANDPDYEEKTHIKQTKKQKNPASTNYSTAPAQSKAGKTSTGKKPK